MAYPGGSRSRIKKQDCKVRTQLYNAEATVINLHKRPNPTSLPSPNTLVAGVIILQRNFAVFFPWVVGNEKEVATDYCVLRLLLILVESLQVHWGHFTGTTSLACFTIWFIFPKKRLLLLQGQNWILPYQIELQGSFVFRSVVISTHLLAALQIFLGKSH